MHQLESLDRKAAGSLFNTRSNTHLAQRTCVTKASSRAVVVFAARGVNDPMVLAERFAHVSVIAASCEACQEVSMNSVRKYRAQNPSDVSCW